MRRYVRNARDERQAEKIRETFMDRPVEHQTFFDWKWPKTIRNVGECLSVM
jgi:hypothetical protein